MPSIVLQRFGGLVPRQSARLLGLGQATVASFAKLWSGELRSFVAPARAVGLTGQEVPLQTNGYVRTIYKLGELWLAWTLDVDVVVGFTTLSLAGQIFYTGDGPPKQTNITALRAAASITPPSADATYTLGVDGPDSPDRDLHPSVVFTATPVAGTGTGDDPTIRYYVYTYYTVFNEESVPSFPSNPVPVNPEQHVSLTGFLPVDPVRDPNITSIRIYRTIGGAYQFVDELFIYASSITDPTTQILFTDPYIDTKLDTELAEPLVSQHYFPPPDDLQGLIGVANGSLAAFHGNSVMFSEPYQPGAWPPEYERIFDYAIVGLGTFGQSVVVCTASYTYIVSGSHPKNYSVARIPDPYPCVSKKSIVSTERGVIYSSFEGLIFVGTATYTEGQASGVHVLTRQLMTSDEWSALYNPGTIIGAMFEGHYYGFYNKANVLGASFIYDFSSREEAIITGVIADEGDKTDILVDLDTAATAVFSNPYVPLHYVDSAFPPVSPTNIQNKLNVWEGNNNGVYNNYKWRSKVFSFPYAVTFSVGKVMFNLITEYRVNPTQHPFMIRLYDGTTNTLLYERTVMNANPFRLPSLMPRTDWLLEVEGKSFVQMVEVATSYQDLNERKS